MPLYLTLSRGPRADLATPVLASSDPRVVDAALEAIRRLAEAGQEGDPEGTTLGNGWRLIERGAGQPEEAHR